MVEKLFYYIKIIIKIKVNARKQQHLISYYYVNFPCGTAVQSSLYFGFLMGFKVEYSRFLIIVNKI
jgi:hypothetical protein